MTKQELAKEVSDYILSDKFDAADGSTPEAEVDLGAAGAELEEFVDNLESDDDSEAKPEE
jgi:hypothetical protein